MTIAGMDNMHGEELTLEVARGGRFVLYYYCVSVLVLTFRRSSNIYFIKAGESRIAKGWPCTLLSLVAGWWGIPWGPIYTIQSLIVNLRGGKDVTAEVSGKLLRTAPAVAASAAATQN